MNHNITGRLDRFLWFRRGQTIFAAPMNHLQEVIPLPPVCRLPGAEATLTGLINLREHILPVFDASRLAISEPICDNTSGIVIVLGIGSKPVLGLLAETVGKVVELASLEPLPESVHVPAAFVGQAHYSNDMSMLVFNFPTFSQSMGLFDSGAPA